MYLCWYILYHFRKSNKVNDIKKNELVDIKENIYYYNRMGAVLYILLPKNENYLYIRFLTHII